MTFTNYLLSIFGIVVSVVLFFIGYKQTIGAKKERIAAANAELSSVLVRRVVLEKYVPTEFDISRLIEGKARDYRVRSGDLMSESQFLNTLFTRIVESDLITSEQRTEIVSRITPAFMESQVAPVSEQAVEEVRVSQQFARHSRASLVLLALLTSAVGGIITVLPDLKQVEGWGSEVLPAMLATVTVSLATIGVLVGFLRLRSGQEETTASAKEASLYVILEKEVRKALREARVGYEIASGYDMPDFILKQGNDATFVHIKAWSDRLPATIVHRLTNEMEQLARRHGAAEVIVVTASAVPGVRNVLPDKLRLMTMREFRKYLATLRK